MIGKRVQFHDETWQELRLLAAESMKSFQELADEAFNDLLKKHGRPASLKEALRKSAGRTAKAFHSKAEDARPKDGRNKPPDSCLQFPPCFSETWSVLRVVGQSQCRNSICHFALQ